MATSQSLVKRRQVYKGQWQIKSQYIFNLQ